MERVTGVNRRRQLGKLEHDRFATPANKDTIKIVLISLKVKSAPEF